VDFSTPVASGARARAPAAPTPWAGWRGQRSSAGRSAAAVWIRAFNGPLIQPVGHNSRSRRDGRQARAASRLQASTGPARRAASSNLLPLRPPCDVPLPRRAIRQMHKVSSGPEKPGPIHTISTRQRPACRCPDGRIGVLFIDFPAAYGSATPLASDASGGRHPPHSRHGGSVLSGGAGAGLEAACRRRSGCRQLSRGQPGRVANLLGAVAGSLTSGLINLRLRLAPRPAALPQPTFPTRIARSGFSATSQLHAPGTHRLPPAAGRNQALEACPARSRCPCQGRRLPLRLLPKI